MNELTKGLTNLRRLRAAVRDLTLEQAESSLLKLQIKSCTFSEIYSFIKNDVLSC